MLVGKDMRDKIKSLETNLFIMVESVVIDESKKILDNGELLDRSKVKNKIDKLIQDQIFELIRTESRIGILLRAYVKVSYEEKLENTTENVIKNTISMVKNKRTLENILSDIL